MKNGPNLIFSCSKSSPQGLSKWAKNCMQSFRLNNCKPPICLILYDVSLLSGIASSQHLVNKQGSLRKRTLRGLKQYKMLPILQFNLFNHFSKKTGQNLKRKIFYCKASYENRSPLLLCTVMSSNFFIF